MGSGEDVSVLIEFGDGAVAVVCDPCVASYVDGNAVGCSQVAAGVATGPGGVYACAGELGDDACGGVGAPCIAGAVDSDAEGADQAGGSVAIGGGGGGSGG